MISAVSPAKVILLGEHSSLYGNPALSFAIDLKTTVTAGKRVDDRIFLTAKDLDLNQEPIDIMTPGFEMLNCAVELVGGGGFDIKVETKSPMESGMGSSASIASSLVAALGLLSSDGELGMKLHRMLHDSGVRGMGHDGEIIFPKAVLDTIASSAIKCESTIHVMSSGLDPYSVCYGGLIRYQQKKAKRIGIPQDFPSLIVAHSGEKSSTGEVVSAVASARERDPKLFSKFLLESEGLVEKAIEDIAASDWRSLGRCLDKNHSILSDLGLNTPQLDKLVSCARASGAYGAKLSGAGKGGIIIVLADKSIEKKIKTDLSKLGAKIIPSAISEDGLRVYIR